MQHTLKNIGTELIKSKKTFAWWLVIVAAGFMPVFISFIFLSKWKRFVPHHGQNPWNAFAENTWKGMGFLYISFFVVLLTCLFLNIEHKNNTWKHIFTLPISKSHIYFNKLTTLLIFLILFYLLFIPIWIGCGFAIGLIKPELQLASFSPDYISLLSLCFHSFIASLGILAIHFWLSMRFKNMIIPIGIAVLGEIIWVAMFQGQSKAITYFPYAFNYSTVNPPYWVTSKMYGIFPQHEMVSILYFIIFSALSYSYFIRSFKG